MPFCVFFQKPCAHSMPFVAQNTPFSRGFSHSLNMQKCQSVIIIDMRASLIVTMLVNETFPAHEQTSLREIEYHHHTSSTLVSMKSYLTFQG